MSEALKWYVEMGVDEAIEDEAIDRTLLQEKKMAKANIAKKETQSEVKSLAKNLTNSATTLKNPETIALDTKRIADECKDLYSLRKAVNDFDGMSITKTATNTVFSDGNPDSEIMFVGEAPGAEEDAQGRPFCGASGQMLDQMLSHIGLSREKNFYITNTVFWRPPGNRRPTPQELAICLPFVEKHIALVKPKLIILVGGTAIASILDSKQGITKMRGQFFEYNNSFLQEAIPVTAIFHPSYLLRSPGQKKFAWQDCLMLKKYFQENNIKL